MKTQVKLGKPKPQRKAMAKAASGTRYAFAHGAETYGSDQEYGRTVQRVAVRRAKAKASPKLGGNMVGIGASIARTTRKNAPAGVKAVKALRSKSVPRGRERGDT